MSDENGNSRRREKRGGPEHRKDYEPDIHRLLPQNAEAEQGVLSSAFLSPVPVLAHCQERGLSSEWFHIPAHALIWDNFREYVEEGKGFDFITFNERLRQRGVLDYVGGAAFISEIFTFLPTAANLEYYADIAEEKFLLRSIIKVCTEHAGTAYEPEADPAALIEALEAAVSALALRRYKLRAGGVKDAVFKVLDKCSGGKTEEAWGLSTGFPNLDAVMRGLRPGNSIAIGGETSSGKTSLALNIVHNLCVRRGISALVFTLEMTTEEVVEVLLQIGSGSNVDAVAERRTSEAENKAFNAAAAALASAPLVIRDEKDVTILQIASIARTIKPRLIVLDYAQLCTGGKRHYDRPDIEVSEISRTFKNLCGSLDATGLLLTQLNDKGKAAGSRTIGNDADQLLIVEETGDPNTRDVRVCKQRRGAREVVHFRFIGPAQKFLPKALT